MANSNEHMREYMKRRYWERRAIGLERLGGKCVKCGSADGLEFDHIDRSAKTMSTARMTMVSMTKFLEELSRCQILCADCHRAKTLIDLDRASAKTTHGTLSALRYCKPICALCREAKNKYSREWKRKVRASLAKLA